MAVKLLYHRVAVGSGGKLKRGQAPLQRIHLILAILEQGHSHIVDLHFASNLLSETDLFA